MPPLTALILPLIGLGPIPGWTLYVSTLDHFIVELPGKPVVSTQTAKSQGIVATTRNYTVKGSSFNVVVTATLVNDRSPKTALDIANGIKMGLMARIGGKSGQDRIVTYSARKGRETRFQDSNGRYGALWITGTPGRIFSLTILGVRTVPKVEADRLFTSFHFR